MKKPSPYPSGEKAAEKLLAASLRRAAKESGFSFTSDFVWGRKGDFVFSAHATILYDRMGAVMSGCGVKPIEADDILWEVLGMDGNKSGRTSLHVTGAFQAPGKILSDEVRYVVASEEEIASVSHEMVDRLARVPEVCPYVVDNDVRGFFASVLDDGPSEFGGYKGLNRCISAIYLRRYREALAVADRQIATGSDIFRFGVGSKGDATLVKEYCERKLAEEGA